MPQLTYSDFVHHQAFQPQFECWVNIRFRQRLEGCYGAATQLVVEVVVGDTANIGEGVLNIRRSVAKVVLKGSMQQIAGLLRLAAKGQTVAE